LATTYIEIIRGVPLITLLFMATFMFPLLVPENWSGNAIIRAQVAIILFAAAYLAEVVRGGLQYVSKGQFEASTALGMSRGEAYRYVVLPQALSLVIAPTVNTFITLLKDTSLVAIVSISELLLSARQSLADPVWRTHFVEVYLFIGVLYFVLCFSMAKWSKHLENKAVLATAHR
jgi:general L-amino acid transport system permease protein